MRLLATLVLQLGIGTSLLFGLPLLIMGLALHGLARRQRMRLSAATAVRRRVADIGTGPVTVVGRVKRGGNLLTLADDQASVSIEVAPELDLREGEAVTICGDARGATADQASYREDARVFIVDATSDEHLVLRGATLEASLLRARLQMISGAVIVGIGLVIFGGGLAAEIFSTHAEEIEAAPRR